MHFKLQQRCRNKWKRWKRTYSQIWLERLQGKITRFKSQNAFTIKLIRALTSIINWTCNVLQPNELKVTVLDNVLKIEAKHEENTEGNHISKQFVRSYVLPAEYKAKDVQSSLSKSGKLTVVVPKKNQIEKTLVRDIPIKMD